MDENEHDQGGTAIANDLLSTKSGESSSHDAVCVPSHLISSFSDSDSICMSLIAYRRMV